MCYFWAPVAIKPLAEAEQRTELLLYIQKFNKSLIVLHFFQLTIHKFIYPVTNIYTATEGKIHFVTSNVNAVLQSMIHFCTNGLGNGGARRGLPPSLFFCANSFSHL